MKKISVIFLVFILALTLSGCSNGAADVVAPQKDNEDTLQNDQLDKNEDAELEDQEDQKLEDQSEYLEKIAVSYEDGGELNGQHKMVVWVQNNTDDQVFTGDIHLRFKNADNKSVGYDMIIVEDLEPQTETWCNIFCEPASEYTFEYNFAKEYSFTTSSTSLDGDDDGEEERALDSGLSDSLTKMMYDNFGGSGKPEFATSWYQYIEKLEVFENSDGTYSAIATLNGGDAEAADRITNTIYANFKDVELHSVISQDAEGNALSSRS